MLISSIDDIFDIISFISSIFAVFGYISSEYSNGDVVVSNILFNIA